jgi:hypothetical protein
MDLQIQGLCMSLLIGPFKKICTVIGLYFRQIRSMGYSSTRHDYSILYSAFSPLPWNASVHYFEGL